MRISGLSFCIITDGKEPEKLALEIDSILKLGVPSCEMLIGGDVPGFVTSPIVVVPMVAEALSGRLGEMRNRLVAMSRMNHIVVADDDLIFHPDYYIGLKQFGEEWDVMCTRILNPDGTRFWDWATFGGPRGHQLMDYLEIDSHVYPTGGHCVLTGEIADRVAWDGSLGFYQGEDVDFARRLRAVGARIRFNPCSTVTHNSPYTQDGVVVRFSG